jgi:hypothetical protein
MWRNSRDFCTADRPLSALTGGYAGDRRNAEDCPSTDLRWRSISERRSLWHVAGDTLDDILIAAAQLDDITIRIADEDRDLPTLAETDRSLGDRDIVGLQSGNRRRNGSHAKRAGSSRSALMIQAYRTSAVGCVVGSAASCARNSRVDVGSMSPLAPTMQP